MNDEARKYRCPACGGAVDEQARTCGYCATPIATARCAHCFHMNVPESIHCSGCGRGLGLEPLGKPDSLVCPDCQTPFEAFCGGPGLLHDCSRCGGQFLEHALLRDLIERRQTYGSIAPRTPPRMNPLEQPVRYIACPSCGQMMNRNNFGGSSGVIVDVCARHGIWFDAGELPRILSFIEAGGLVQARRSSWETRSEPPRGAASVPPPSRAREALLEDRDVDVDGRVLTLLGEIGTLMARVLLR
ncbi:MAG: zf-TFIIB domain-containing protein [Polyangiaceae bacterium]|nr:zf-TFIIB domain-containing protein [Polyangiaceae bacterium]